MKTLKTAGLLFALLLAAMFAFLLFQMYGVRPGSLPAPKPAVLPRESSAVQASATLFPGLDESAVTAISVITPDRSFHFLCEGPQAVSVNGQLADGEVFRTLLDQISELPVDFHSPFAPQAEQLLLTLTVSSGQAQHTARFYADGKTGEKAHIVSGSPDAPQYRQTGGWRVGTLTMTCEGTRILDALGNEIPAAQ